MATYTITHEELQTLLEAAADLGARVARTTKNRTGATVAQSAQVQAWTRQQLATRADWENTRTATVKTYPGTKTIVK